jgi:hypothetical protein
MNKYLIKLQYKDSHTIMYGNESVIVSKQEALESKYVTKNLLTLQQANRLFFQLIQRRDDYKFISIVELAVPYSFREMNVVEYKEFK